MIALVRYRPQDWWLLYLFKFLPCRRVVRKHRWIVPPFPYSMRTLSWLNGNRMNAITSKKEHKRIMVTNSHRNVTGNQQRTIKLQTGVFLDVHDQIIGYKARQDDHQNLIHQMISWELSTSHPFIYWISCVSDMDEPMNTSGEGGGGFGRVASRWLSTRILNATHINCYLWHHDGCPCGKE